MKDIKLNELYHYITYKQLHLKHKCLKYMTCCPIYYCSTRDKYVLMINDDKDSLIWSSKDRILTDEQLEEMEYTYDNLSIKIDNRL